MHFSKVIFKNEIDKSLQSIFSVLNKKLHSNRMTLRSSKDQSIFISNKIQVLLNGIYHNSHGIDSMLAGMLLECVHESEKCVAGSSYLTLNLISKILSCADNSVDDIELVGSYLKKSDVSLLLQSFDFSKNSIAIIDEAIKLAGISGKIFINNVNTKNTTIELKQGYNFPLILPIGPFIGEKKWEKNNCSCFVIDGVIESLGEIDGILQDAAHKKIPLTIFARGFGSDVLNTIKLNNARTTLDVLPISFGVDNLKTVNSIADIARVIGTDVVSPFKGDITASFNLKDFIKVQKIICYNGNVTIINSSTHDDVCCHINDLSARSADAHFETATLLNERIRSLSSTCVLINIGNDVLNKAKVIEEELDAALNLIKAAVKGGVSIPPADLGQLMGKQDAEMLVPLMLLPVARKYAKLYIENISSLSIAIINDN